MLRHPNLHKLKPQSIALYSDLPATGTFSCSHPKLNQLHHNILWSMKSNFFDGPTDCPQRDERLGWTEDADVFCPTACFLMDVKDFYRKWLTELRASQDTSGAVPVTVPGQGGSASGWSDAATFTPWTIFQRYGDTSILRDQYASMKAWVEYVRKRSPDGLWKDGTFGDWYPAGPHTPNPYLDQCCWYRSTAILVNTAQILGYQDDVATYTRLLQQIKDAFDKQYLDSIPPTQAAYVVGLHFGLLPKEKITTLVDMIHRNDDHLATGFMGTPYLLTTLSENGYADLAMKLLLQEDQPSWLYMVDKGATTMWEKWNGIETDGHVLRSGDISYNHYAFGSVGRWMYEHILGIQPQAPGYSRVRIAPYTGGGLTWAKGSFQSVHGMIKVDWKKSNGKLSLHVVIPPGVEAEIVKPASDGMPAVYKMVEGGEYTL